MIYVGPFFLILADWVMNRIDLSMTLLIAYPIIGYSFYYIFLEMMRPAHMAFVNIMEFVIFVSPPDGIAVALPAIVFATVYMATWIKFWFLDEGDLREYRFWSMIDLIQRTLGELPDY